ncbi:Ste24 endopeptidase [Catenulispora acidiphila DSM 44928]|uniref:Ste24 endopeptidase n=1 Tax=Catenulispora acidiphila (strain DSM 44928 / JCM 14897 / NBRC 102108 / NRRL B-24433 / ID139908) TaxID=479433 RepID=C7QEB4_CATAD|nr:M48 family metallopeptidase [Catenulispora acidiphila]ACU70805.1 Ste24 endopeptidase [Catenulispora acidiphila DSM 44928]
MDYAAQDFTPEQIERARAYKRSVRPLRIISTILGLAVPLVLGLTPAGAGLVRVAGDVAGGGWVARALLGSVALSLLGLVLRLPLSMWSETVSRRWGLSKRGWGLFAADTAKGFLIGVVLTAAAIGALYALMRHAGDAWWVWAALAAALLALLGSFIMPVLIEPLFNKFKPLPDGPLRERLMALVEQSGVPVKDILVSDSSRRTTAANAYVSGLGKTRRLVVWDTTTDSLDTGEVAAIAAHELGHAARRDVLTGTVFGAVGAALGVAVLAAALHWSPLLDAAGVDHAEDPRSQALVRAVLVLIGLIGEPWGLAYSRYIEGRADGYALDLFRDPDTIVRMERALAVQNIADLEPRRWEVLLRYTHPPIPARIAHARGWAAQTGVAIPKPLSAPSKDPGAP